jgi:hypothetical protein
METAAIKKGISRILAGFVITGSVLLLFAFKNAEHRFNDLVRQLGLSESMAHQYIWENISKNYFSIPRLKALKDIAANDRPRAAKEFAEYVKVYIASDEFNKRYEEMREQYRPKQDAVPIPDSIKKQQKENLTMTIAVYAKFIKEIPKDQRPCIQKQIDLMKEQLIKVDDPNPALTQWQKDFPSSPVKMIRASLEKFLDHTNDIDFSATLKQNKKGKWIFTNSSYEAKPETWKMCYRAGKESTEIVREIAMQYLEETKITI